MGFAQNMFTFKFARFFFFFFNCLSIEKKVRHFLRRKVETMVTFKENCEI